MYVNWKTTSDPDEYIRKKINFKTFEKIVGQSIVEAKNKYYYSTFLAQKNDIKKTWCTINTALNRCKQGESLPNEFMHNDEIISDTKIITNTFNNYFVIFFNN